MMTQNEQEAACTCAQDEAGAAVAVGISERKRNRGHEAGVVSDSGACARPAGHERADGVICESSHCNSDILLG
jgi:hypothetical protein